MDSGLMLMMKKLANTGKLKRYTNWQKLWITPHNFFLVSCLQERTEDRISVDVYIAPGATCEWYSASLAAGHKPEAEDSGHEENESCHGDAE